MFKYLRVCRPLVFVDLETTGLDSRSDRIIEIAMMRTAPGTDPLGLEFRLNPERPIPPAASAVHGIRDEHVIQCPPFAQIVSQIAKFIGDADLAGFGVARFDLPFLLAEFERAGWTFPLVGRRVIDALTLFHMREPRDLATAVRLYCNRAHAQAHRAAQDVLASAMVLDAMLDKYPDVPRDVAGLHDHLIPVDIEGWFKKQDGVIVLARGKYRDVPLKEIACRDPSYLAWLTSRMMPDARRLIENAFSPFVSSSDTTSHF